MLPPDTRLYFENPVGRVLEHTDGYAIIQYNPGPRRMEDLQSFLIHTGRLLQQRGWNRILGDQRQMERFTQDEGAWIVNYWLTQNEQRPDSLYGAVILPRDAFASLSVSQVMHEARAAALTFRMFDEDEEAAALAWLRQAGE